MDNVRVYLDALDKGAKAKTTCTKTWVGACVGTMSGDTFYGLYSGYNENREYNCKDLGCYRTLLFGNNSIETRPWCKSIHAEENAILKAIKNGVAKSIDTIVVTRYPCDKCAKLIVHHGIKNVYYGRSFEVSDETKKIFKDAGVNVVHLKDWESEDKNDCNK